MASLEAPLISSTHDKFRIFMIPFFATGHLIPVTELARLLGKHGKMEPIIVTTPANATLIRPSLDSSVKLLTYPFPSVGLPPGVENLSTASSNESWRIDQASSLSKPQLDSLIRAYKPDAIISDIHYTWTANIALELSIPRFIFYPIGIFAQIVIEQLFQIRSDLIEQKRKDPYQCFGNVPGLPGLQVCIPPSELPDLLVKDDFLAGISDEVQQARVNGSGAIVNTFYDLESDYYELYKKLDPNTYLVGPLGLSTLGNSNESTQRGGKADMACLDWLSSKEENSVVFVCFGSWSHFNNDQLHELALGLESSGKNFLWAVRGGKDNIEAEWMPEGWEKRVEPRGLIVHGWVPQLSILRHVSVGAFLTHCGWNSVLEALTTGTPMLTWPLAFEQFITERLVVEVKGCGARVWEGGKRSVREEEREVVPKEVIAKSVSEFMQPFGAGNEARFRAQEIASKANIVMNVDGSSRKDLGNLIDCLLKSKKK